MLHILLLYEKYLSDILSDLIKSAANAALSGPKTYHPVETERYYDYLISRPVEEEKVVSRDLGLGVSLRDVLVNPFAKGSPWEILRPGYALPPEDQEKRKQQQQEGQGGEAGQKSISPGESQQQQEQSQQPQQPQQPQAQAAPAASAQQASQPAESPQQSSSQTTTQSSDSSQQSQTKQE